jgi:hypothetical protein
MKTGATKDNENLDPAKTLTQEADENTEKKRTE